MAYRVKRGRGLGVVAGGTDVNAPVVTTFWWCPVPGLPVSSFDHWLGCPSVNGISPYGVGSQPSSAAAEAALSVGDSYRYVQPTSVPNPAVGAGTSTTPAPYDCSPGPLSDPRCPGYDAALAASTAQQKALQDAANSATMKQTLDNLKQEAQAQCPGLDLIDNGNGTWSCPSDPSASGTNWLLYAALAVGGLLAVDLFMGGRR